MSSKSDEDWSIISSSSDIDDERSTTSSVTASNGDHSQAETSDHGNHVNQDSSIGTLRLPNINSTGKSPQGEDVKGINGVEFGSESEDNTTDSSVVKLESNNKYGSNDNERPIDNIINFYESLSSNTVRLHKSIKQKSDDIYKHLAKQRLIDLNNFIEGQQDHDPSHVSIDGGIKCRRMVADLAHNCNNWLEGHSEYLIYFMVLSVSIGYSLNKLYSYYTYQEPESMYDTFLIKSQDIFDSLFYEQKVKKTFLFTTKDKQLRFSNNFYDLNNYFHSFRFNDWLFLAKNSVMQNYHRLLTNGDKFLINGRQFLNHSQRLSSDLWSKVSFDNYKLSPKDLVVKYQYHSGLVLSHVNNVSSVILNNTIDLFNNSVKAVDDLGIINKLGTIKSLGVQIMQSAQNYNYNYDQHLMSIKQTVIQSFLWLDTQLNNLVQ